MDTLVDGEDPIFGIDEDPDDKQLLAAYGDMDAEDLEITIPALASAASNCSVYLNSFLGTAAPGRRLGSPTIKRRRRSMHELFQELGPSTFRRMYRMREESFFLLLDKLDATMNKVMNRKKRTSGATPNGDITNMARLSMALRWFAGGDKLDIAALHCVHVNEVYKSVWCVVDAVNAHRDFDITFPTDHNEQQKMAASFAAKSKCGFENVVAAVDGMLVWINKPSDKIEGLGVGPGKCYCGRKKKYGLQMQAVCDANRRFVDVYVGSPGSASDFTVWLDSPLRALVETPGFLKDGLVIAGDNAYINTLHMVCPFRSIKGGPKDAFNFFHSQLRINIECAFGMLVHKWGCLRKPMPVNFKVANINRLVLVLCKLHNFCIDYDSKTKLALHEDDNINIGLAGGLTQLSVREQPRELIGAGHDPDPEHRSARRRANALLSELPVFKMLQHIEKEGYQRPPTNTRR
ncbi:DDE superfamily endonuclease [Nitzschia inconspicua]|uniref:DDE superfamily endonuclease n=1 Tax=Nitzschia inconspicua TaxID=303405 RepID=A0A9K3Q2R3_9STRA|nr:DDE superfamily endonuclease [Nitzschia inconspicua]